MRIGTTSFIMEFICADRLRPPIPLSGYNPDSAGTQVEMSQSATPHGWGDRLALRLMWRWGIGRFIVDRGFCVECAANIEGIIKAEQFSSAILFLRA